MTIGSTNIFNRFYWHKKYRFGRKNAHFEVCNAPNLEKVTSKVSVMTSGGNITVLELS